MLNDLYTSMFPHDSEGNADPRELLPFGKQRLHLNDVARITTALKDVNHAIDSGESSQECILFQRALLQKALQLTSVGEVEEALRVLEELRLFTIETSIPAKVSTIGSNSSSNSFNFTPASTGSSIGAGYIKDEHSFTRYVPTVQNWEEIEGRFKEIFPDFFPRLLMRCATLTHTELKICAMLKSTLKTKDIARLLNQSERNIENHRYRIRKKLHIPNHQSLAIFLEVL